MDKRFLGIVGVIILIFIGIAVFSGGSKSNNNSNAQPSSHVEGLGQKSVTLVEYGDYECPICEAYYIPVKQVVAQFNSQIHFQFRNLPLVGPHPNAFAAARAAEAASLQGKFWQMHDKLYDNQNDWIPPNNNPLNNFIQYAQQIGLNVNQFKSDYSSSKVNDTVNADINAFLNTSYANHDQNKEATPTFFLDGKYLDNHQLTDPQTGAPSVDKFAAVLNAEISAKNK